MEEGIPPPAAGALPNMLPLPAGPGALDGPSSPDATPRRAGAHDVISAAILLLEREEPAVAEALRVLRSGQQLLALAGESMQGGPPSPTGAAPAADRRLLVRVVGCSDLSAAAGGAPLAPEESYLILKCGGAELRSTTAARSHEPLYQQLFAFPMHSEETQRGSSGALQVELWHKNRLRGDTFIGGCEFEFGMLTAQVGTEPPRQPLQACKEGVHRRWAADAKSLPGSLECFGQTEVPPIEWSESSRDFTRAFVATASGSGDMLLLGCAQIEAHGTMKPIRSGMPNSGDVNQEVTATAVQEFRTIMKSSLASASLDIDGSMLDELCHRLIDNLTVTPAMQVLVDHDVMPAMYQNKFIVLSSATDVRVVTYGFIGPGAQGDRPDRKHTDFVIRLLTENLVSDLSGEPGESSPAPEDVAITFSVKLSSADVIDDVISEDLPMLIKAVSSGDFGPFVVLDPLPEAWGIDSWWRLENDRAYGTPSTGLLRVGLAIQTGEPRNPAALAGGEATEAAQLMDQLIAKGAATPTVFDRRDHDGYEIPQMVTPQAWTEIDARLTRSEELSMARWYSYLCRCPRICPLPIGSEFVEGKEVSKPHVSADLRRLIIDGIPCQWSCDSHVGMQQTLMEMGAEHLGSLRAKLWLELTGARDLKLNSEVSYHDMKGCTAEGAVVKQWLSLGQGSSAFETMTKTRQQIAKDVPRTSPGMSEEESQQLKRLLLTFVLKFPSIGYCQSMNFVALALLRAMRSEENAFWVLGGICVHVLHGYYTESMSRTQVDMQILSQLVEQKLPAIHTHLAELECPLELMVTQWLLPIYITTFPAVTAFAIWDWLFVDGSDILLMVAMAFLSMFEAAILDCRDFGDVTVLFAEKPLTMYRSGALLQRARAYQDEIGTAKLSKLREAVTAQVAISGEENNKERMVRQMVKETHLTEEDISHLHEKFMELEQQARAKKAHRSRATSESGDDVHGRRQRRGSMTRLKTGLKSFKKTDLDGPAVDTIYEDREIDFDTFKQLIHSELPQWARASDDESLRKLFHAFDGDGSGTIGVNEFISGLAIFMSGDIDHKLRMIFRTTDTDGSGKVEEAEMLKLFQDCYRLFYPQMSQKHIPELVRGIFTRLEIDPDLDGGLNFDDFCLVVKSQPLLLECFTLDTLDARQRDTAVPSDQAAGVDQHQHHGKLCTMEAGKKGKERWKDRWYVLSEGVLSFYTSEDAARKGNRHGRIDLRSSDVQILLRSEGGGKSGKEELLHIVWQEHGQERELKCCEPPSGAYDFDKGLTEALELHRWHDNLQVFMQSDKSASSMIEEMTTLTQMPSKVLEQVLRYALLAWRQAESAADSELLASADEAVTMSLTDGLPTVSSERHGSIKAAALQVIKTGGADSSILAMVRRGCAYEQVEELLSPLGFNKAKAKVFYTVVSEFVRKERAAAFEIVETTGDSGVSVEVKAQGKGLASVAIFSTLADDVRDTVAAAFSTCCFEAGAKIFLQGDTGDAMYLIVRGDVEVVKEATSSSAEKVVAVLSAGHCFGEMSLLSAEVRSASMRCRNATVCCVLRIEAFHELVAAYPDLKAAMVDVASERAAFSSRATSRALSNLSGKAGAPQAKPVTAAPAPAKVAPAPHGPRIASAAQMDIVQAKGIIDKCELLEAQLDQAVLDENYEEVARISKAIEGEATQREVAQCVVDGAQQ